MPFSPFSMTSGPNMGSINMPKLLRTLKYRTNNVRKFLFHRDAIFEKDVGTVKDANADGSGRTDALAGPAVSFGYETGDNTTRVAGTDRAYHVKVDEMNLYGLEGLIVPTSAATSSLGRTGNTHSGSCDIYIPTLNQLITKVPEYYQGEGHTLMGGSEFGNTISNSWLDAVGDTYFDRFESGDELVDMERIVHNPASLYNQSDSVNINGMTFDEGDNTNVRDNRFADGSNRLQFKIKHSEEGPSTDLEYVTITGVDSTANTTSGVVSLKWTFSTSIQLPKYVADSASYNEILVVDLPLIHSNGKNIKSGDTYVFSYAGSQGSVTATATVVSGNFNSNNEFEFNKLCGDSNFDNGNELNTITLGFNTAFNIHCAINNDPTITLSEANDRVVAGLGVTGTGIPDGATVASVTDSTHFELSVSTTGGQVSSTNLRFTGADTATKYDITDIAFYEATNWVINGITEYRDEYIKLSCNKYRGSSPSRRRAHG